MQAESDRVWCFWLGNHARVPGMRVTMRLDRELGDFLDCQVTEGHYASRSAAVTAALAMWRGTRLQPSYTQAFASIDPLWDLVAGDGIDDEQWL